MRIAHERLTIGEQLRNERLARKRRKVIGALIGETVALLLVGALLYYVWTR